MISLSPPLNASAVASLTTLQKKMRIRSEAGSTALKAGESTSADSPVTADSALGDSY